MNFEKEFLITVCLDLPSSFCPFFFTLSLVYKDIIFRRHATSFCWI